MPAGSRSVNKQDSGIGLIAKPYQHHEDSNHPPPNHPAVTKPNSAQNQWSTQAHSGNTSADPDGSDLDDDESTWALDEASEELSTDPALFAEIEREPGRTRSSLKAIEKSYAIKFLSAHPRSELRPSITALPVPVVIPQRRPHEASGGFVLAYPPLLDHHAGINQETFLDFLHTLNASYQTSTACDVINMAAFAAMFSPIVISHVASFSAHAASSVSEQAQSHPQRNTFLDKVNAEFFQPRGLWCMVVTWRPQARESRLVNLKDPQSGQTHNLDDRVSTSSAVTSSHMDAGICASLTHCALDVAHPSEISALRSKQQFVAGYLDRRTRQAAEAEHNPEIGKNKRPRNMKGSRRLIRQDVCYLMIVNHPAQQPQQH